MSNAADELKEKLHQKEKAEEKTTRRLALGITGTILSILLIIYFLANTPTNPTVLVMSYYAIGSFLLVWLLLDSLRTLIRHLRKFLKEIK
jgi:hypothetical protein